MASVHFFSRLISSWFAFALPLFRSFQALQQRPASEPDVERLTKYWIVIGALLAFEYSVEFLVSWFPFYWEIKFLVLLFISLPQLQGSTYIYDTWMAPFLVRNEGYLDHQIVSAQENFFGFFQVQLQKVIDLVMGKIQAGPPGSSSSQGSAGEGPASAIQGAVKLAMGMLTTHGASLAGKPNADVRPAGSRASSANTNLLRPEPYTASSSTSAKSNASINAHQRNGFASESQASLPIPPELIYRDQMSRSGAEIATPTAFPEPEHF